MPAALDEQPLLRIDIGGLARRDVEEQRIELGKAIQQAAPFAVASAARSRPLRIRIVEAIERPALRRQLADAVPARPEIVPVLLKVARPRIAPADADDGDRLAPGAGKSMAAPRRPPSRLAAPPRR